MASSENIRVSEGWKYQCWGRLGGSVGEASDFSSGRDLVVRGFEPRVELCADSLEAASDSLSLSLPLLGSQSVSFSKIDKYQKTMKKYSW